MFLREIGLIPPERAPFYSLRPALGKHAAMLFVGRAAVGVAVRAVSA
jgi:hypothetical protein